MTKPTKKKNTEKDFHLNKKYYKELVDMEVYSEENKIGKIFGVKDKKKNEEFIQATSKYTFNKKKWSSHYGFRFTSKDHVSSFIRILRKIAVYIGWVKEENYDLESLKKKLGEKEEQIIRIKKENEEAREEHDKLMKRYMELSKEALKTKYTDFKKSSTDFETKIKEAYLSKDKEQEMQNFLYNNSWLFGTEYINAKPQKMRGANSRFDFYLERFNKTNDIVEIKLISDPIINKDGSISAKVIHAVDQIIDYMESTIAVAHSVPLSEEEEIKELRPRGIVIIGNDTSKKAVQKLHKWNYQLSKIHIITYSDVLKKGKTIIKNIEKKEDDSN